VSANDNHSACWLTSDSELSAVAESDDFPEDFFKVKVLPELLKSVEFGGGGPKSFALVMRIASKLSDDEYDAQVTPVIVRLFASPDRALRVCLLDNLPSMIDHLSQKLVTDKIFPQMVTGFGDLAPVVREQTVKAVLVVTPKLSERIVNGELLRHLAKTANDEQPGIRTNTTICLGKIARNLSPAARSKVLSAAFSRALRDPFVHARNAALMSLAATADIFTPDDCAAKMMPAICPSLVDKEKMIRDQANKTLNIYLDRVRKFSQTLPDTVLPPTTADGSTPGTRISTPQPAAGGQWVGWAISSFTNKLSTASGEIQPNSNGSKPTPMERPSSTPAANGLAARPVLSPAPSAPAVPQVSAAATSVTAETEDFGAEWGDMDDQEDAVDAWGEPAADAPRTSTTSHHSRPSTTSSVNYDDGGEPDFEGWLNAQAAAKQQSKRPLPKGLAPKKAMPVKSNPLQVKKAAPTLKSAPTAKPAPEEDDWGSAWD
jgi:SCY1-like protein 1